MGTIRLTAAQAMVRCFSVQITEVDGDTVLPLIGCRVIFGHDSASGLGEALRSIDGHLSIFRALDEQAMADAVPAHDALYDVDRPGITDRATAHVDRLSVMLLPDDVSASGRPLDRRGRFLVRRGGAGSAGPPGGRCAPRQARPALLTATRRQSNN